MKRLVLMTWVLVGSAAQARSEPAPGTPWTLEHATRLALEHNAEVRQARAQVEAAQAVLDASGRLLQQNPELEVEAGADTGGAAVDVELGLSQPLEVGGQRGARRAVARSSLAEAQALLRHAEHQTATQVREAFAEALAAQALLALGEEESELATRLLEAARAREQEGDGTRLEVNVQLLETGRVRAMVLAARRRLTSARAALRQVTGAPVAQDAPLDGTLESMAALTPEFPGPSSVEAKLAQRPDVRAAHEARAEAEAALRLVTREAIPTPSVGVLYKREQDLQIVSGTLSVPLPVFDRAQAAKAEARGAVAEAMVAQDAALQRARTEVEAALARCETARAEVRLYEGALAEAAEETSALARDAYRSGKLNLMETLALQRAVLATRAAFIEARLEWVRAGAELTRALGP